MKKNQKYLLIVLNLKKSQPKINFFDFFLKKSYNWSVGVILKFLLIKEKSIRRSFKGLKILLSFAIKKILKYFEKRNYILKIKGLKSYVTKVIRLLDLFLMQLKIDFFFFLTFKSWDKKKIKSCKNIKRRVKKRLILMEKKK